MGQTKHQWNNFTFECDKVVSYWKDCKSETKVQKFEQLLKLWNNVLLWYQTMYFMLKQFLKVFDVLHNCFTQMYQRQQNTL